MKMVAEGGLEKMQAHLADPVEYHLMVGDEAISLNELLGKKVRLHYLGAIHCIACGKTTKKSFNQGYCYPCFLKLAQCDNCIMNPEKCHYDSGTCREPDWALQHCFVDHVVYLSHTSGPKVGITRGSQVPVRWIDQGATQALPVMSVKSRYQSGLLEAVFRQHVADKTSWQAMLKGGGEACDMFALRDKLLGQIQDELTLVREKFATDAIVLLDKATVVNIRYPVLHYPDKVKSLDFEKQATVEGVLQGIKGQYLLLDSGVINIRKFTSYQIQFSRE